MRRCRPLLGTYVEIGIRDLGSDDALSDAMDAAFDAIADVDRRMSFHRPDSDLSRLNAGRAGETLALHASTVEVLRFARELHEASDGVFDPGVGATLVDWNVLPRHAGAAFAAPDRSSIAAVEILDETHVRLREPACIDLGGLAKGYAVDKAIEALAAHGIGQADVNAGGDLRILGDARPVHVRRPDAPSALHPLGALGDGAMATSAAYFSTAGTGADGRCDLVDPRTGMAPAATRSFTVVAPTCMVADGLTKVLALAGHLPADSARRWDARGIVL